MARSLLDWAEAARWGEAFAHMRPVPAVADYHIDRLHRLVHYLSEQVHPVIHDLTSLHPALDPPHVRVVSRAKLVAASVDSMRGIADPHAESLTRASKVPAIMRRHVWAQHLGAAAGLYASTVLGQHELFIPPAHTSGRTWMVGPNVTALVKRVGAQANDIISGVLCTQLTNRLVFEGVPWIRPYAKAILNTYIREIDGYDKAFIKAMERFSAFFNDVDALDDGSGFGDVISMVLTPRQVRAIHAGQAFFAVIEGYANLISHQAYTRLSLDTALVTKTLTNHAEGHHVMLRFTHVIPGMGITRIDQTTGQAFVRAVADEGGIALVNRLWEQPQHLPTLAELAQPTTWMARVGAR